VKRRRREPIGGSKKERKSLFIQPPDNKHLVQSIDGGEGRQGTGKRGEQWGKSSHGRRFEG